MPKFLRTSLNKKVMVWTAALFCLLTFCLNNAHAAIAQANFVLGQPRFTDSGYTVPIASFTMKAPYGVLVTADKVYVVDQGNHRILWWNSSASYYNGRPADGVIGQPDGYTNTSGTSATKLQNPDSIALDPSGNLWVADNTNHRVLRYPAPLYTGMAADLVLGQTSFSGYVGGTSRTLFYNPTGVTVDADGNVWVADYYNHRVLGFSSATIANYTYGSATNADYVLGQTDFTSRVSGPTQSRLSLPHAVAMDGSGHLWVAEYGSSRVSRFDSPKSIGSNASLVLGQTSYTTSVAALGAAGMRNPRSVSIDSSSNVWVADGGNARVLKFNKATIDNFSLGTPTNADLVLGQAGFNTNTQGLTVSTMNYPMGVTADSSGNVWVADSGNSRVLKFTAPASNGAAASLVLGQPDMISNLEAWKAMNRPYDIVQAGNRIYMADTPANRVLWWDASENYYSGKMADGVIGRSSLSDVSSCSAASSTTLCSPYSVAVDSDENVWVADATYNRVLKFAKPTQNGEAAILVLGQTNFSDSSAGSEDTKLRLPRSVGFDPSGNLWVADTNNNRVVKYTAPITTGQAYSLKVGVSGSISSNTLNGPQSLSVDPSGNLWVADSVNNRVLRYSAPLSTDMAADLVLGQPNFSDNSTGVSKGVSAGTLSYPMGVRADSHGNIWVADHGTYRLLVFTNGDIANYSLGTLTNARLIYGQDNFTTGSKLDVGPSAIKPIGFWISPSTGVWVCDSEYMRGLRFTLPNTISGRVTKNGAALAGFTISLGLSYGVTDSNGDYSMILPEASYSLAPSSYGYAFSPPSRAITLNGSDVSGLDFVMSDNLYVASGTITLDGNPMPGVLVTVSGGGSSSAYTNAAGQYSFTLEGLTNYTITPSSFGYAFTPASVSTASLVANWTNDFTARNNLFTTSGTVTLDGTPMPDVLITLSGSSSAYTYTTSTGYYSFDNLVGLTSYTITPSSYGYVFTPASVSTASLAANWSNDFAARNNLFTTSGTVTLDGTPMPDVLITLSGSSSAYTYTSSTGYYSFDLVGLASYTITPYYYGYEFTPASASTDSFGAGWTNNFTARNNTFTISGTISASGSGVSGVMVSVTGSTSTYTVTDSLGNYSFALEAGGGYTVTPSLSGYTFSPVSVTTGSLAADWVTNFTLSGLPLGLVQVNPSVGLSGNTVSVSLTGSNFPSGTTVTLTKTGHAPISATGLSVVSSTQITCSLPLGGAAAGVWNITVQSLASSSATLAGGFIVANPSADHVWVSTGSMITSRWQYASVRLQDGRILVAGGYSSASDLNSAEIYNPATGVWSSAGTLNWTRYNGTAVLLPSGKVLLAGGIGATGYFEGTEIYDPVSNTWSATGSMNNVHGLSDMALLPNGKVLIAGGQGEWSEGFSELYDPDTGVWTNTTSMSITRDNFKMTLLPNGKVLVSGGTTMDWDTFEPHATDTCEVYDYTTGQWTSVGSMNSKRHLHKAVLLPNGNVLVSGGANYDDTLLSSSEIFDSTNMTWTATSGSMSTARIRHAMAVLPDQTVLVAGGTGDSGQVSSADIFNSNTGVWTSAVSMNISRAGFDLPVLPDGNVLAIGGYGNSISDTAEVFTSSLLTYVASGTITLGGSPFAGVDVTVSGSTSAYGVTDSSGNYSFALVAGSSYTITPTLAGYMFSPVSVTTSSLAADWLNNFTAQKVYTASGTISFGGSPMAGVVLTVSGDTSTYAVTDSSGNYSLELSSGGHYVVTPASTGYAFTPASVSTASLSGDWELAFTVNKVYTASGTITLGGSPFAGVNVTVSGSTSAYGVTDSSGNYSFSLVANNSYTITPSSAGYVFTPVSVTTGSLAADWVNDFTGAANPILVQALPAVGYNNATLNNVLLTGYNFGTGATVKLTKSGQADITVSNVVVVSSMEISCSLPLTGASVGQWNIVVTNADASSATLAAGFTVAQYTAGYVDNWQAAATMITNRSVFGSAWLPNGKLLVAGGSSNNVKISSAEIYAPSLNSWTSVAPMLEPLSNTTLIPLRNGKVFAAGTREDSNVEIYDVEHDTWTAVPTNINRGGSSFTLLPNGKVLAAGGYDNGSWITSSSATIYDPDTNSWTDASPMPEARNAHLAVLLANGKVLVVGGYTSGTAKTAALYDPKTNAWASAASPTLGHNFRDYAALLPGGKVLVGGAENSAATEVYDPDTNSWASAGSMRKVRYVSSAALLPDGKVIVSGGEDESYEYLSSSDLYDPETNSWSVGPWMNTPRVVHRTVTLPNGNLMAIGGWDGTGTSAGTEILTPAKPLPLIAQALPAVGYNNATLNNVLLTGYNFGTGATVKLTKSGQADITVSNVVVVSSMEISCSLPLTGASVGQWNIVVTNADASSATLAGGFRVAAYIDNGSWVWRGAAPMSTARAVHESVLLPNGQVLVFGGEDAPTSELTSSEIYDPQTNSWSAAASMNEARGYFYSKLLPNGKVLAYGGGTSHGQIYSAELYDPETNKWSVSASTWPERDYASAVLMANGKMLVSGGTFTLISSVTIYDPESGIWNEAAPMANARNKHSSTLLTDGRVLVVGGNGSPSTAEIYNPGTDSWTTVAPMLTGITENKSILLANGKVLVIPRDNPSGEAKAQVYDVVSNSWAYAGTMWSDDNLAKPVTLPDGKVLLVGGGVTFVNESGVERVSLSSAMVYNPDSNSWAAYNLMSVPRNAYSAVSLSDGRAMITGGFSKMDDPSLLSVETFTPTPPFTASGTVTFAGNPFAGATVTVSGSSTAYAVTDSSGNYSFSLVAVGNYTLTPYAVGYNFTPVSLSTTGLNDNWYGNNFTAALDTYIASGTITLGGSPFAGVNVTVSGSTVAYAVTDSSGAYSFTLVGHSSYTITPSIIGYSFSPVSVTTDSLAANWTNDFAASIVTFTVSGTIIDIDGTGIAGVNIEVTGSTTTAQVTDSSGAYSFSFIEGSSITVTPSLAHYRFYPVSVATTSLAADWAEVITGVIDTFTVSGTVTKDSAGWPGVNVAVSGSSNTYAITDSSGNYSFTLNALGEYTITPAITGYHFEPVSVTTTSLAADWANSFAAIINTYTVAGRAPEGSTITVSGSISTSTVADGSDNYSFELAYGGNYTLTPTLTGFHFDPVAQSTTGLAGSWTPEDFNSSRDTYTVSGTVMAGTAPVAGVAINAVQAGGKGGLSSSTVTDENGNFSFPSDFYYGEGMVVTPEKEGFFFTPVVADTDTLVGPWTDIAFEAHVATFTVSGTVSLGATPFAGVNIAVTGSTTTAAVTDDSGNYSFVFPYGSAITVTPSTTGYHFDLPFVSTGALSADWNNDFAATINTYTVSGAIMNGGVGIAEAAVQVTGSTTTVFYTNEAGAFNYKLPFGSYTLTPVVTGYHFDPVSISTALLTGSWDDNVFTATVDTYTVSGQVTKGGSAWAGVNIAVTGSSTTAMVTDASGNYSFSLDRFGNYTITPSTTGYYFNPVAVSTVNLSANWTGNNFAASIDTFTVSGTVSLGVTPFAGVNIAVTGSTTTAAVTDGSGNYSFVFPYGSAIAVTPSTTGYHFNPVAATTASLAADWANNFAAVLDTYTASGYVALGSTITVSGDASMSTVAVSGTYSFELARGGSYTITPSKTGYHFTPVDASTTALVSNWTNDFMAAFDTFTVSGQVTLGGSAMPGVNVAVSGSSTTAAVTDGSGNYSFVFPYGSAITVTPSTTGYHFNPVAVTTASLMANWTGNDFAALIDTYTVSGTVSSGSTITVSGDTSTSTYAASGSYSFELARGGSYTITPAKTGYHFTPVAQSTVSLTANWSVNHFSATLDTHTVSGTVMMGTMPVAGVTIVARGVPLDTVANPRLSYAPGTITSTTVTDANGNFSFPSLFTYGRSVTVTPSKAGNFFTPVAAATASLVGEWTDIAFEAHVATYTVSGQVSLGGWAWAGVNIAVTGSTTAAAVTDGSGIYSFILPYGGSYTVTPSTNGYYFTPSAVSTASLVANWTNNFAGTINPYTVSGRVTLGGSAMAGVNINVSGSASTAAVTDANGDYTLMLDALGSYTVTPSSTGYYFNPVAVATTSLSGNWTGNNFAATLSTYTVSGTVKLGGNGMPNAVVALSGGVSSSTVTDANGDYSFIVNALAGYTVTPSSFGFHFAPFAVSTASLVNDWSLSDFTATINTYTVAGTVLKGTEPVAGVTITVAGNASTSAVTNASGSYSFVLTHGGQYSFTPSLTGSHFSPVARSTGALVNDWLTNSFTAVLDTFTVSGMVLSDSLITITGATSTSTVANSSGAFSVELEYGGAYTLTPAKTGYHFTPPSVSTTGLVGAWSIGSVFTPTIDTYTVTGAVLEGTVPLAGVAINITGSTTAATVTDSNGQYSLVLEALGHYQITPSKLYYQFAPVAITTSSLVSNWTGNNFAATFGHVLSGVIKINGVPMPGVTVTVNGSTETSLSSLLAFSNTSTTVTDANGYYSMILLPAGHYTVTPTKDNFYFNPPNLSISSMTTDVVQDFRTASTGGNGSFVEGGDNGYVRPGKGETAKIRLTPAASGHITIKIYTLRNARLVKTLEADGVAGSLTTVTWDCLNTDNQTVGSGVYVVVVNGAGYDNEKIKMGVLR